MLLCMTANLRPVMKCFTFPEIEGHLNDWIVLSIDYYWSVFKTTQG